MSRELISGLNLGFAIVVFVLAVGLLLVGAGKTIALALLPVGFANLTFGLLGRKKVED